MNRSFTMVALVFGVAQFTLTRSDPAMAGAPSLEERFKAEFPAAAERNEKFFSQLSGSGTFTYFSSANDKDLIAFEKTHEGFPANRDQTGGELIESYTFAFAIDGPLQFRTIRPIKIPKGEKSPKAESKNALVIFDHTICLNRDSSFEVSRSAEGAPPRLREIGPRENRSIISKIGNDLFIYLSPIYRPFAVRPQKYVPSPDFVVKKLTPKVVDGAELLRVDFEIKFTDAELPAIQKSTTTRSGWFITRPNDGWVIQEALLNRSLVKEGYYTKVEFGEKQDGIPLPRKVIQAMPFIQRIVTFDRIRHGPTPESAFSLTAFGLPEIDQTPRIDNPNRTAYWLIGVGVVVLLAAIGLKVYARRPKVAA